MSEIFIASPRQADHQFPVRPRRGAGYIAGLGAADPSQLGFKGQAKARRPKSRDLWPASASIMTSRAPSHRQRSAHFMRCRVDRQRLTMNVWARDNPFILLRNWRTIPLSERLN